MENITNEEFGRMLVKSQYCDLIWREVQKLNEDQLFKVLVLVKNTTDAMKEETPEKKVPSKNRALLDPNKKLDIINDSTAYPTDKDASTLKKILNLKDLNRGYGIISMRGACSDPSYISASEYICFCIPDKVDLMVEVFPRAGRAKNIFILSAAIVGEEGRNVTTFYSLDTLEQALDNIVKKYKNNE